MAAPDDEEALRAALRGQPDDPVLWANLGRLLRRRGAADEALGCYRRAADRPDAPAAVFFNLGNTLCDRGEWAQAEAPLLAALHRDPTLAAALLQAGRCALRLGRLAEAGARFDAVTAQDPENMSAWLEAASLNRRLGDDAAALRAYLRAAAVAPARFEGHLGAAQVLEAAGRFDEAAAAHHRAVAAAGPHARTVDWRMARERLERGDVGRALEAMRHALAAGEDPAPDAEMRAEMHADLCVILLRLGMVDQVRPALEVAATATAQRTLLRLADEICHQGAWAEALPLLRRNVALRPANTAARQTLARCLIKSWRFTEGLAELDRAEAGDGAQDATHLRAYVAAMTGDVDRAVALYRRLGEAEGPGSEHRSSAAMASLYSDRLTPQDVAALHRALFAPLGAQARDPASFRNARMPERILRVGLVTPDLHHHHPVNLFLQPLLARLQGTGLDVTVYDTGRVRDAQMQRSRERVRSWVEAADLGDAALAERIEADAIDILLDLAGHSTGQRAALFARRAAPVQVAFLGYPGSTGLPGMDWIVGDPVVTPAGDEVLYSERVARMPHAVFCFAPEETYPLPVFDAARPLTFGSFNSLAKLTPRTIRLWTRVLAAVPDARLILKTPSFTDAAAARLVAERFAAEGLDPARLDLHGPSDLAAMMEAYGNVDIGLDPVPYNGGTTTLQAMWMGVPVVCLLGGHFVSRMAASFMHAAGLDSWIAHDDAAYVAIAARMAADRPRLLALKRDLRLRQTEAPAWDADLYARDFETVLRGCWRDWCAGSVA